MGSARTAVATALCGLAMITVAACSGGSANSAASTGSTASAPSSASPAATEPADPNQPSDEIVATCAQIVADAMPQAQAEDLAAGAGFTTRIGSVDGEPNPMTMDYRLDRMTFDVEGGIVVNCLVG